MRELFKKVFVIIFINVKICSLARIRNRFVVIDSIRQTISRSAVDVAITIILRDA